MTNDKAHRMIIMTRTQAEIYERRRRIIARTCETFMIMGLLAMYGFVKIIEGGYEYTIGIRIVAILTAIITYWVGRLYDIVRK